MRLRPWLTLSFFVVGAVTASAVGWAAPPPDRHEMTRTTQPVPAADATTATGLSVGRLTPAGRVAEVSRGDLELDRLDPASGVAVLRNRPGTATRAARDIRPGDVVASRPTQAAPHGALVKVTDVIAPGDTRTTVKTAPATLADALGDANVHAAVPVDPKDITVKPLRPDVRASVVPPGKVAPDHHPLGALRLDLTVPVGPPKEGVEATLAGWVQLQPEILFRYERKHADTLEPQRAAIGLGGTYEYGWSVAGRFAGQVDTGDQPIPVPFAELHTMTVFTVLGVPVVVNVDLTYSYRLTSAGTLSVWTEQRTSGSMAVGAEYEAGKGWSALPESPTQAKVTRPVRLDGTGAARVALAADLRVSLYGMAGVGLQWAPYLRAEAARTRSTLTWAVYAGFDLNGSVGVGLKLFGVTLLDYSLKANLLHHEWRLADDGTRPPATPSGTVPPKTPTRR